MLIPYRALIILISVSLSVGLLSEDASDSDLAHQRISYWKEHGVVVEGYFYSAAQVDVAANVIVHRRDWAAKGIVVEGFFASTEQVDAAANVLVHKRDWAAKGIVVEGFFASTEQVDAAANVIVRKRDWAAKGIVVEGFFASTEQVDAAANAITKRGTSGDTPILIDHSPAENGSHYGDLNENGVPKTVPVNGYFRADGTYVRGYYRSPPGSNPK